MSPADDPILYLPQIPVAVSEMNRSIAILPKNCFDLNVSVTRVPSDFAHPSNAGTEQGLVEFATTDDKYGSPEQTPAHPVERFVETDEGKIGT